MRACPRPQFDGGGADHPVSSTRRSVIGRRSGPPRIGSPDPGMPSASYLCQNMTAAGGSASVFTNTNAMPIPKLGPRTHHVSGDTATRTRT
jgi:hypothetical protein